MLHNLHRSAFLRPRDRLYELLALHQADVAEGLRPNADTEALLDHRTLVGFVRDLEERRLLERRPLPDGEVYVLTPAGRGRLRLLMVDFARELSSMSEVGAGLLRRSLVALALRGVRRVALYPFGETAEAVYAAMEGMGFDLVAIVDDAPEKQGLRFHDMRVQHPAILRELRPEAVVITTTVFEEAISRRLTEMGLGDRACRL